jgi:RNA-directed DNA polymerase
VSVNEGFDFLGFNVRRYGNKSLIKPEQGGRQTDPGTAPHRAAVPAREQRSGVIKRLNPIIRGWAVSAEIFGSLDQHLWELTFKWARFSHANKPTRWVVARYFDRFNKARQDRWVFGDRASGAYLHKFAWTNIVRHQIVDGAASPGRPRPRRLLGQTAAQDAPADRQDQPMAPQSPGRSMPGLPGHAPARPRPTTNPARVGTVAGDHPQDDHQVVTREDGMPDEHEPRLIHADCRNRNRPALLPAYDPEGLA